MTDSVLVKQSSTMYLLSYVLSLIGFGKSTYAQEQVDNNDCGPTSPRATSVSFSLSTSTVTTTTSSSSTLLSTPTSSHHTLYENHIADDNDDDDDDDDDDDLYTTAANSSSMMMMMMEKSTVYVNPPDKPSLSTSLAFQHWIRQLPKIALLHHVSTSADPMMAYDHLLATHYMDQEEAPPFESISTRRLWKELHWIQTYARTLVHQLDPLRPNEQFAQAKEITNRLLSLIRLCSQQHGDDNSLICVMALILVAHECLGGTTAVVRQDMFYRTKVGRTIVLEMSSLFKNYKVGNDKATSRQQHALAILLFDGGDWYSALEIVCGKLSRLDENWEYRNEYHQVITLASSHHLD